MNANRSMNANIDIELLINTQPAYNSEKKYKTRKMLSKICVYNFFSINEIRISEKIRQIPYYSLIFNVIEKCNFIKIGQINDTYIESIDIPINKDEKYLLLQYNDYREQNMVKFADKLLKIEKAKEFIFCILNTYPALLDIFYKLREESICFFDLSCENILLKENGIPLLQNVQNSLLVNKLNESYISTIIEKITDYTCKPLEVYVLFYLIINKEETLSYYYIETIVAFFIDNMNILSLFPQNFKDSYKQSCIDCLKKYINQPKSAIISDILTYSETWDNYSLSIIYLHIIGNIIRVFLLKDTFLNDLLLLLVKNINPNPSKRETLEETSKKYENLFNRFTNWEFIKDLSNNELSKEKMQKLHNLL
jgi:hypothetical protein